MALGSLILERPLALIDSSNFSASGAKIGDADFTDSTTANSPMSSEVSYLAIQCIQYQ